MENFYNYIINTVNFQNNDLLILIDKYGNLWFKAIDITTILEYNNTRRTIQTLVDKEDKLRIDKIKLLVKPENIKYKTLFINEAGLYSLLIQSRKPIAKTFKKWITKKVLPEIRKNGKFILDHNIQNKLKKYMKIIKNKQEQINILEENQKKEKYDKGAYIYVAQIPGLKKYVKKHKKIGITNDMNKRLNTYNTSTPNKTKILYSLKVNNPICMEKCIDAILHPYRYRTNREYYNIDLNTIIKTIHKCVKFTKDKIYNCDKCNKSLKGGYKKITQHYFDKHDIDDSYLGYSIFFGSIS